VASRMRGQQGREVGQVARPACILLGTSGQPGIEVWGLLKAGWLRYGMTRLEGSNPPSHSPQDLQGNWQLGLACA
jgi:hypothetical protein